MKNTEDFERKAYENAISSVRLDARFPQNIFVGTWGTFLFFEESWIFEPQSIEIMHDILDAEGSHSICLVNLGNVEVPDPLPARYVDRSTDADGYLSLLVGNGRWDAWLYLRDRYIFASDVGDWCIYCERQEDLAVLAIRRGHDVNKLSGAISKLYAKPLEASYRTSRVNEFRFEELLPAWRSALLKNYVTGR